jgi:hypothetical protein
MKMTSVFAPITKSVENDDGTMYVYGKATGPDLDLDQQRCDAEWLKTAMPEWFQIGNIREQHDGKRAAGKAVEHDVLEDGHYIKAHIVDPIAVLKVKNDVYTGLSIGIGQPRVEKSTTAPNGLIKGGKIFEVSLVDRPALPTATFRMCKTAKPGMEVSSGDFDSSRMLVRCGDFIEKAQDEVPEMTVKLGEALTQEQKDKFDQLFEQQDEVDKAAILKGFNRDQAIDLVTTTLEKAESTGVTVPPIAPPEELDDIMGAKAAIALIAQLIQSEAADMVCAPNEDYDIELLLQAVGALRCFICREKGEPGGDGMIMLAADSELGKKAKYNAEQLRSMLASGKAMKNKNGDPSYPIADKEDLQNAIHAVGRGSGDHDAIRAYIKRRASAIGASNMIPESWSKNVEPDLTKAVQDGESAEDTSAAAGEDAGGETSKSVSGTEVGEGAEVVKEASDGDGEDGAGAEAAKAVAVGADSEPELTVELGSHKTIEAVLTKVFTEDDSAIHKSIKSIVEAAQESTAKSISDLVERLEKVEQMGVPGGPSQRRTEVERSVARKHDLESEVVRYKSLAMNTQDQKLRKGYTALAAKLEAEINSL